MKCDQRKYFLKVLDQAMEALATEWGDIYKSKEIFSCNAILRANRRNRDRYLYQLNDLFHTMELMGCETWRASQFEEFIIDGPWEKAQKARALWLTWVRLMIEENEVTL